jgi:hypothetical protein
VGDRAIAVAIAVPRSIVLTPALHGLSRRWGVLVPAGFVIVDPLTLSDPVLFLRERILRMQRRRNTAPPRCSTSASVRRPARSPSN